MSAAKVDIENYRQILEETGIHGLFSDSEEDDDYDEYVPFLYDDPLSVKKTGTAREVNTTPAKDKAETKRNNAEATRNKTEAEKYRNEVTLAKKRRCHELLDEVDELWLTKQSLDKTDIKLKIINSQMSRRQAEAVKFCPKYLLDNTVWKSDLNRFRTDPRFAN